MNKEKGKQFAYHGSSPDEITICTKAMKMGISLVSNENGQMKVNFLGNEQMWQVKIVIFLNFLMSNYEIGISV